MKCPTHLKEFVEPIGQFATILPGDLDDLFVGYRLKCICSNHEFTVKKNNRPLVMAYCTKCHSQIVVYDTGQYPDACSYANEGELETVISPDGNKSYTVCVAFEYPEPEDGEEYGDNDISWCYIYGCPNNSPKEAFCIIDDETM